MNLKTVLKYFLVLLVFSGLLTFLVVGPVNKPQTKKSQYSVIISFDDNPSDYFSAIKPMKQYGYVGVACVIVNVANISILNSFATSGWEIASHSMTHPNLTSVSAEQLNYEISQSKIILEQEVPQCAPIITFAYPFNDYNSTVEETVAKYYKYGRTATVAWNKTKIWDGLPTEEIPGLAIGPNNYGTDLPKALSTLQSNGGNLVLVFHAIGGEKGLDTRIFIECLEKIKRSAVTVVTFKDVGHLPRSCALFFDGIDDYVEVRHNIILEPQLPFAIEAWVKADQPSGNGKIL